MYLILYKETMPTDEQIVERIWTEFYGESIKEGAKSQTKERIKDMY